MRIKKVDQAVASDYSVSGSYTTSDSQAYSCNYINNLSTDIESGSNTNGSWIKFPDGTMIINQKKEISQVPINTTWGGIYLSSTIATPDYPVSFVSVPNVLMTFGSSTQEAFVLHSAGGTVSSSVSCRLARGSSLNYVSGTVDITAIGRWKA